MTKPNKTITLRTWTDEQLQTELDRLRDELYHFRYKMRVEEVENPNAKETLKRNIARVQTIQRQREIESAKVNAAAGATPPQEAAST